MDSLTHLALGAVIGEAIAGKELGKKAMWLGAAVQFFPDIDFIEAMWLSPAENLVAHRGITHSIFFSAMSTIVFALIAQKVFSKKHMSIWLWLTFFGTQAGVHIFLDAFNAYGIGVLEPFSSFRLSFHTIYVADPLFSIWILMAAIVLVLLKGARPVRFKWVVLSLAACSLYLVTSLINKSLINKEVKRALELDQIVYQDFLTTPTPFNDLLWYVVVKTNNGFYTGYRSVFDISSSLELNYFPLKNELTVNRSLPDVHEELLALSQQYYVYTLSNDTLRINLVTFGQVAGWDNPAAPFVLSCDLIPDETTLALLQEGRAGEMNRESLASLMNRIFNEKTRR